MDDGLSRFRHERASHVMVLGAGITGVTTAWFLRRAGFRVSVIERRDEAAQETSFANGGQISVSHPEPWANPLAPFIALRWMGRAGAPLKLRPRLDAEQWQWMIGFLRECLPWRSRRNTAAIAALAVHSLAELRQLREVAGIADSYDARGQGVLHLFFEAVSFARAQNRIRELGVLGIELRSCTAMQCAMIEPALAASIPWLAGGLYAPDDESGDTMRFCQALTQVLAAEGVNFHYGAHIERLRAANRRVTEIEVCHAGGRDTLPADAVVVCLGSYGRRLLRPLGEHLPIYPLKGYSVTAPVSDALCAPRVSLTDESRRIVCSRLGERLRIAGTAELNGYGLEIDPTRITAMLEWAETRLPGAIDCGRAMPWAGLRPSTPGGVPIVGRGERHENLWLNTGHGTLGWTLACGSASTLAALMRGETPPVQFPFWGG
ncbi:MAG: D-amino acid dehydrogenase [Azoarcus sp.]|jgi:D-amino-acid dehydrogenase|nr:D-amino acid dehydrogenase [Azoarcus sp.]